MQTHSTKAAVCVPAPMPPAADPKLAKLLAKYQAACAAGDTAKARKLAVKCLDLDPTCFGR
jgi:hypothetical protein